MRVSHHLLLCATPTRPSCCDPAVGAASWERLKARVRDLGLDNPERPQGVVWRTKADCLRICRNGPILHIWPDGITYGEVTAERIEAILRQHVIGGRPIREWILERVEPFAPPPGNLRPPP
jgi:(2Fe-2S) ferredoxin